MKVPRTPITIPTSVRGEGPREFLRQTGRVTFPSLPRPDQYRVTFSSLPPSLPQSLPPSLPPFLPPPSLPPSQEAQPEPDPAPRGPGNDLGSSPAATLVDGCSSLLSRHRLPAEKVTAQK